MGLEVRAHYTEAGSHKHWQHRGPAGARSTASRGEGMVCSLLVLPSWAGQHLPPEHFAAAGLHLNSLHEER